MKVLLSMAALFAAALVCHADLDLSNVKINGTTDKSALSYKAGEEMVYRFKADLAGQKPDGLFLQWERKGDDGEIGRAHV